MATNSIDKKTINDLKAKLEWAHNVMDTWKLKIIKDTAKELFDIFTKPENVADFSLKDDIKEVEEILEKRKIALESRKTIKKTEITEQYRQLNIPGGTLLIPEVLESVRLQAKDLYENKLAKNFKSTFPTFENFTTNIREHTDYKISDLETTQNANTANIKNVYEWLKKNHMFLSTSSPEIKEKLTRLIILFAQLDLFNKIGTTKNQLDAANKILAKITVINKQLKAYETTKSALIKVTARETWFDWLEKTDPKDLANKIPNKWKNTNIAIDMKDHFLDPAKGLTELPEWYELSNLKLKDGDKKEIELFEDTNGKKFEKTIKVGEPGIDIFVKDAKGTYTKIGKIEIPLATPTKIELEIQAYKDLPFELKFPTTIEMDAKGIGGNKSWSKINDKVSISKKLSLWLDKPKFNVEYIKLEKDYKINDKLDKIFDETYKAQLKDRLYEFMESDDRTKWERARMNSDEKNHFFQDVIMSNSNPVRLSAGIYGMITNVIEKNCQSKTDFENNFKKWILEIFTGKSEADLKKLIFEKLGTLDFTELNPTYAIKVLADKIRDKYTADRDGLYKTLNAYLLNVREGGMKVTPEKLRLWELAGVKEIKSVIADSKEISREDAYRNSLKKIEDEYKSWVKFGFKRAKIFFFREKMLRNLIAKELKWTGGLNMDDPTNSAVNRRATEKSMGGSFAENMIDVEKDTKEKIFDDPIFQEELNKTVVDYLTSTGADAETTFKTQVEELINDNSELRNYMKKNNITHLGTNIIEQTKAEKEERNYYTSVISTIDKYTKDGILNKPQEYEVDIRNGLDKFIKEQHKLPDMVKSLWLNMDKIDFATKLATHRSTLETMRTRTVKMRLSLLVNKSEEEKWLTTAQYVNQDKFDVKHAPKFTKRMAKHPRWTTGATALWLVGTGVVGALTMPIIGVWAWASILWYLNFLKKKGHYTQEHKKFEETIIAMTPEQREKYLEDLKENSEKRPKRIRRVFPTTYSKYGKSMEYFNSVDSAEGVTKKIQRYLEKSWPLTATEMKAFRTHLVDGISLIQAHKEKWRNFMYGKEGDTKVEELYNQLYKIILAGVTRYNPLAKNPETVVTKILSSVKTSKKVNDTMDEYDESYKNMRQMRAKLGIFAGTKSAAIYLGSAYALWWIKNQVVDIWDNIFGDSHNAASTAATSTTPGATVITTPPATPGITTVLDPAFGPNGDILKAQIFNGDVTQFNTFVAKVQNIPVGSHSERLRSIFRDMYGTDQLANEKTHDFFNLFSSRITDMPASAQQELIRLWTNFNIHSGHQIADLMTSRWYHGMVTQQADINSLLAWFKSGAIDLNNLPAWWTKETACNVLFCNTHGDQLTDLIFDTAKSGPIPGPIPWPIPGPTPWPTPNPRYKNFLSFWVPTVWNEVKKFNKNDQEQPQNTDTEE